MSGPEAKRNRDSESEQLGGQRQLEGDRKPFTNRVQNRLVGPNRTLEIAVEQIADPMDVSRGCRIIEAGLLVERRDLSRCRLRSENLRTRSSRQQVQHETGSDRDKEQRRQSPQHC